MVSALWHFWVRHSWWVPPWVAPEAFSCVGCLLLRPWLVSHQDDLVGFPMACCSVPKTILSWHKQNELNQFGIILYFICLKSHEKSMCCATATALYLFKMDALLFLFLHGLFSHWNWHIFIIYACNSLSFLIHLVTDSKKIVIRKLHPWSDWSFKKLLITSLLNTFIHFSNHTQWNTCKIVNQVKFY